MREHAKAIFIFPFRGSEWRHAKLLPLPLTASRQEGTGRSRRISGWVGRAGRQPGQNGNEEEGLEQGRQEGMRGEAGDDQRQEIRERCERAGSASQGAGSNGVNKAQRSHFKHPAGLSSFVFFHVGFQIRSCRESIQSQKEGKLFWHGNHPREGCPSQLTHTPDRSGFISGFASHFGKSLGFPGWISGRSAKI